jgi:hypothetical protein
MTDRMDTDESPSTSRGTKRKAEDQLAANTAPKRIKVSDTYLSFSPPY